MFSSLKRDYMAVLERDPAARAAGSWLLIPLCYSGFQAVFFHRISHFFHARLKIPVLPRLFSQLMRFLTGVEIHPGAKLGPGIFIDHGMGVVIGETAQIGEDVTIYQGVTLGGVGYETGKRHPTVGSRTVIGAGSIVLGNIVVGNNVTIGGGSVVVKSVPDNCTVVGVPGVVVRREGRKVDKRKLDHADLPDPVADRLSLIQKEIDAIEHHLHMFREETGRKKEKE